MLFHDVSPSREECIEKISAALQDEKGRIYLDANVLIHCFEMSSRASDDLLSALGRYDSRVGVPIWAANETWEHLKKRVPKKPLQSVAGSVQKQFASLKSETSRYVDDNTIDGMTRDEFQTELGKALGSVEELVKRISHHEPSINDTTERLLPFIDQRRIASKLPTILSEVQATANWRTAHRIPPGYADANVEVEQFGTASISGQNKGKQINPNGDLIIWLEILEDCVRQEAEHLIVVTRDIKKGDWAYKPDRVRDKNGRPHQNKTGLTLASPLLVYEAEQRCPSLKGVHVVTVELLAQIWTQQRVDVRDLAAALQSEEAPADDTGETSTKRATSPTYDDEYVAKFNSEDIGFDPDPDKPLDVIISDLVTEGWQGQNQAVRDIEPELTTLDRSRRIQVGRGLVSAANLGALEPAEMLARALNDPDIGRPLRSDLIIGALAEVYLGTSGEPKKPIAKPSVVEELFNHSTADELTEAYNVVLTRLKPVRREYLALPNDSKRVIATEVVLNDNNILVNVLVDGNDLLEEDAPKSRTLHSSGNDIELSIDEVFELIAEEFVVPSNWLKHDLDAKSKIVIPDLLGFINWGPKTGVFLR
ncbi:PIN-like domain-containing protein [uncultured Roseobacter sp.]|nr:PIN-like domain-containing protein [uncultured Roseobacter sp.]